MSEERAMYHVHVLIVAKTSQVPFQPKEGIPAYCQEYLPKHRSKRF